MLGRPVVIFAAIIASTTAACAQANEARIAGFKARPGFIRTPDGVAVRSRMEARARRDAITVSAAGIRHPAVAVNAAGLTAVAWERWTGRRFAIEARVGRGPHSLGRVRRFGGGVGVQPYVAVGADGTAALEWYQPLLGRGKRALQVSIAAPGRGFGRAQTIERRVSNLHSLGVVVQPNGRVVAIYQRKGGTLGVALAARHHRFGAARTLAATGTPSSPSIVVDPRDGAAVIAYGTALSPSNSTNPQAAVITLALAATAFTAPVVLSAGDPDEQPGAAAQPSAVAGPGGAAVAYILASQDPYVLKLARRSSDGSWSTPQRVGAVDILGGTRFPSGLLAGLPAGGASLAAWSLATYPANAFGSATSTQTMAAIVSPSGDTGTPTALTPANTLASPPAVVAARDEAFVSTAIGHGRVELATWAEGSTRLTQRTLAPAADGDALLAAGGSHVLAAFQRDDRLRLVIVR